VYSFIYALTQWTYGQLLHHHECNNQISSICYHSQALRTWIFLSLWDDAVSLGECRRLLEEFMCDQFQSTTSWNPKKTDRTTDSTAMINISENMRLEILVYLTLTGFSTW